MKTWRELRFRKNCFESLEIATRHNILNSKGVGVSFEIATQTAFHPRKNLEFYIMPRGRMLNRKISLDTKVAKLSLKATLLFSWLIPHTDAKGRIIAIPETIKGNIIPLLKHIKTHEIKPLLKEMQALELIQLYGDDNMYLQMVGFEKNQRIDFDRESPSTIPEYMPNSRVIPEKLQSNSGETPCLKEKFKEKFKDKDICASSEARQIVDYFNEKLKKNFKLTDYRVKLIKKRLKDGFIVEQIKQAIDNFAKDDWGERHKFCDLKYVIGIINGIDKLERWIDYKHKTAERILNI